MNFIRTVEVADAKNQTRTERLHAAWVCIMEVARDGEDSVLSGDLSLCAANLQPLIDRTIFRLQTGIKRLLGDDLESVVRDALLRPADNEIAQAAKSHHGGDPASVDIEVRMDRVLVHDSLSGAQVAEYPFTWSGEFCAETCLDVYSPVVEFGPNVIREH